MRWDLAGSSLGDSSKESGSLLRTRREIAGKKIGGLDVRLTEVAGIYGKGTTFAEISAGKPPVSRWIARTIKSEQRATTFNR
ncbi:hypothetical protein BHM03_00017755 [Ensete ventricosum]|nr:hypothetical protein BHM03_00017755 [Ensete ventricosum]